MTIEKIVCPVLNEKDKTSYEVFVIFDLGHPKSVMCREYILNDDDKRICSINNNQCIDKYRKDLRD